MPRRSVNLCLVLILGFLAADAFACGIAGIVLFERDRSDAERAFVRELTTRLLVATEPRGPRATGLVLLAPGEDPALLKGPYPAREFVQRKAYRDFLSNLTPKTRCIIGHTRLPTQGSPRDNHNNHPIVAGPIFGVHNGHIENSETLFDRFGFERSGQVDSEVIFRLLEHFGRRGLDEEAVRETMAELRGSWAVAFVDARAPERVYLVRKDAPLTAIEIPELALVVFNSKRAYIEQAIEEARRTVLDEFGKDALPEFTLKETKLQPRSGIVIDAGAEELREFDPFVRPKNEY